MWGVIGATLVVFATTIDDTVWLIPYTTSQKLSVTSRVFHGVIFCATLETLAVLCCLTAQVIYKLVGNQEDWIFGLIGATLCWIIAAILFLKKLWKKRRWQQLSPTQQQSSSTEYGAVAATEDEEPSQEEEPSISFSPWTVISLTFLGALDEISYFPTLLVGGVFANWELCLGTLLAAGLILLVITTFLSQCKPLIEWLDSIPLYGVVALFAIVLTIGVIVDLISSNDIL